VQETGRHILTVTRGDRLLLRTENKEMSDTTGLESDKELRRTEKQGTMRRKLTSSWSTVTQKGKEKAQKNTSIFRSRRE
jgi:hypothetical protein